MPIDAAFDLKKFTNQLWDEDEAFELIKAIDQRIGNYEFTYRLAKYLISDLRSEGFDINDLFNNG